MKTRTLTAIALLLLTPLVAVGGPLPVAAVVDRTDSGVVTYAADPSESTCYVWLRSGEMGQAGTGTCVACEDGRSLVVTNAHVVEDIDAGSVVVMRGRTSYPAKVLAKARASGGDPAGWDLALVLVEGELTPAAIADRPPAVGDRVRLWGYGGTSFVHYRDGTFGIYPTGKTGPVVVPYTPRHSNAAVATISGDSGSGWFNDRGELVAVHWGNDGRAWAVPLDAVRKFVRDKGTGLFPRLAKRLGAIRSALVGGKKSDRPLPQAPTPTPKAKADPTPPKKAAAEPCPGGVCPAPAAPIFLPARRGIFRR